MCFDNGIKIRKLQIATMCIQYEAMITVCDNPIPETRYPSGSHNLDGPSPDSIMNEVEVIVKISRSMKLPSNWDLPFSFSGVNTTLLARAATQPTSADAYPSSTIPFQGPTNALGRRLPENQLAVARSSMSLESIKKPQNIRTCRIPTTLSSSTLFCPSQPVATSITLLAQASVLWSGPPMRTNLMAF